MIDIVLDSKLKAIKTHSFYGSHLVPIYGREAMGVVRGRDTDKIRKSLMGDGANIVSIDSSASYYSWSRGDSPAWWMNLDYTGKLDFCARRAGRPEGVSNFILELYEDEKYLGRLDVHKRGNVRSRRSDFSISFKKACGSLVQEIEDSLFDKNGRGGLTVYEGSLDMSDENRIVIYPPSYEKDKGSYNKPIIKIVKHPFSKTTRVRLLSACPCYYYDWHYAYVFFWQFGHRYERKRSDSLW